MRLILSALLLTGCLQGGAITTFADASAVDALPDGLSDSPYVNYALHGCGGSCDDDCACPPQYQACVATCGHGGKKFCLPEGAFNSQGCLAYGEGQCINDECVYSDAGTY